MGCADSKSAGLSSTIAVAATTIVNGQQPPPPSNRKAGRILRPLFEFFNESLEGDWLEITS